MAALPDLLARLLAFSLGVYVVVRGVSSAIRTFVLPRSAYDPISALLFRTTRRVFALYIGLRRAFAYEARDRILALYAPVSLILLPLAWLATVLSGYTLIYWALGAGDLFASFTLSGSSLLTLGFEAVNNVPIKTLIFTEAALGMILSALLISYLPTIYSAFSRREAMVALLEVRAGTPPFVGTMMERFTRLNRLDKLGEIWRDWEKWFAETEESHTSLVALVFFRSPQPDRSWVTAAGAVLDSAAFVASSLDLPRDIEAEICVRAGYVALRRIADYFQIEYNRNPRPDDPISISKAEYEDLYDHLAELGTPLKADREQAWRDFSGWRVNYDAALLALSALTMPPYAPWSSDRSAIRRRRRR